MAAGGGNPNEVWTERIWMIGNLEGDILREPVSLDEVRRDLEAGRLKGHELLAKVGSRAWRPIEKAFARAREIEGGGQPSLPPSGRPPSGRPPGPPPKRPPSAPPQAATPAAMAHANAPLGGGGLALDPSVFGGGAEPMPIAPPAAAERWYLARAGTPTIGPLPTDQVLEGLREGKVPLDTQACRVGDTQWTIITKVPAFASAVPAGKHEATSPSLGRSMGGRSALVAGIAVVLGIVVAVLLYFVLG
jgi:hypothetical protein